jgi:uncharacterized protein
MKYILFILIISLFILYVVTNNKKIHTIHGKVARTEQELKKGLMYRKHTLNEKEGMLFVMHQNYDNSVWMKNTYISLDVIFLDNSMNVVGYKTNTKPLSTKTISINDPSSYILEMNANTVKRLDIQIGDTIHFKEH